MLLTESLGWNCLQVLKSHLSGRLARFTRNISSSSLSRNQKWRNDAAFFEADLRYIFTVTPVAVNLSEDDYFELDQAAESLLTALNNIANEDFAQSLKGPPLSQQSILPERELPKGSHGTGILDDKYPRLSSLIVFLETSPGQFNLAVSPGTSLFTLPEGEPGRTVMDGVIACKALLERSAVERQKSKDTHLVSLQQTEFSAKGSTLDKPEIQKKRASVMINAIFKDFRQRDCARSHEIKLRVSEEWQTGTYQTALDMFISCCNEMVWQEAECGSFEVMVDEFEKNSICTAIQRARAKGKKLYLFIDQRGLFDISDKMPPRMSSFDNLSVESLDQLLDQKVFTRITPRDYLAGTATDKFSSREKALLALSLARCLMDFFDQDLELASYSWRPETLYFLRSFGTHPSDRVLYISLKPKISGLGSSDLLRVVGPGNPVLLSFARLLLEIDSGDKIPMEIHSESKANLPKWAELCDFVNVAEREGSTNYLKAVEGCLYLHMTLPKFQDQATGSNANELVRKAIYEQIVRNLELMVNPGKLKRKERDSVSELPLAKKLSILSPDGINSSAAQPCHTIDLPAKKTNRPASRDEFETAIVCALSLEYDAMCLLIDEFWDEDCDCYGKADGDPNIYTTGRIGKFNIVLVLLSGIGKVSAAAAAASLRSSYPRLRLAIVTGICGGAPYPGGSEELLLGDVVISRYIVQYDFGRQYPEDFVTKNTVEDSLGRASKSIRSMLAVFETELARDRLEFKVAKYLQEIQKSAGGRQRRARYQYPGASQDRLFQSHYQHRHHLSPKCLCAGGQKSPLPICKESRQLSCDDLGCDSKYLVQRERLESKRQLEQEGRIKEAQAPSIFIGSIGSGDTVMKSGKDRDRVAKSHSVIAFEMESAGIWDEVPCIVVKAVCDYADSHKNKAWQDFAAATAASTTKALLERYIQTDKH